MRNKVLKIILLIAFIILAVYAVNLVKDSNKGVPSPNKKGSPFQQK
ncbi:hypothetical protein [Pedobacter deserti]|nr:hypothetical protein [Pedobacter sp. SYSU D00382]